MEEKLECVAISDQGNDVKKRCKNKEINYPEPISVRNRTNNGSLSPQESHVLPSSTHKMNVR